MRILLLLGLLFLGLAEARAAGGWLWCAAGDSLTRHEGFEYPYAIEDPRWRRVVVAEPGGGVWDVVDGQLPRIVAAGATLVTLEVGTNDIVQGPRPAAMFVGVLDWTVAFLRASDPRRVVVLGLLPPIDMYPATRAWTADRMAAARQCERAYNDAIRNIARRRGCRLWAFPRVSSFVDDGFHPDASSHHGVAASLRPLLPGGEPPEPRPGAASGGLPTTWFPQDGPAGTVVTLRGPFMDSVKRVVWFTADGFHMCPIVDRDFTRLTCWIPKDAAGALELWAIRSTGQPSPSDVLNTRIGTFRIRSPRAVKTLPVTGVWLGTVGTAVVRADVDQSEDRLSGRVWSARDGRVAYEALRGTVRGDQVTLSGGGIRLTARLSADGRALGALRRW